MLTVDIYCLSIFFVFFPSSALPSSSAYHVHETNSCQGEGGGRGGMHWRRWGDQETRCMWQQLAISTDLTHGSKFPSGDRRDNDNIIAGEKGRLGQSGFLNQANPFISPRIFTDSDFRYLWNGYKSFSYKFKLSQILIWPNYPIISLSDRIPVLIFRRFVVKGSRLRGSTWEWL